MKRNDNARLCNPVSFALQQEWTDVYFPYGDRSIDMDAAEIENDPELRTLASYLRQSASKVIGDPACEERLLQKLLSIVQRKESQNG